MSDEGKKIQEISSDYLAGLHLRLWEVQEETDENQLIYYSGNIKMYIMNNRKNTKRRND